MYITLNRQRKEIRLLEFVKNDGRIRSDATIHCKLRTISLDNCPAFFALSYPWGDPKDLTPAKVNGIDFPITRNLAAALGHLRSNMDADNRHVPIFADAICINQKDLAERKDQVSLMGHIYGKAEEVVGWLGDSQLTDVNEAAGYLIESWAGKGFKGELDEELDIKKLTSSGVYTFFLWREDDWVAIRKLFNRPFWSRRWILQEVVLAHKLTFCFNSYPRKRISFETFEKAVANWEKIRDPKWAEYTKPVPFIFNVPLERFGFLAMLREWRHKQGKCPTIVSLLRLCQSVECSLLLDRFYAILNLVDDTYNITPDYGKVPADLFTDFTRMVMAVDQTLNILADAGIPGLEGNVLNSLPSWVPDWKAREGKPNFQVDLYRACGNIQLQYGSCGNKYHLRTSGAKVFSIKEVESANALYESPRKIFGTDYLVKGLHRNHPSGISMLQAYLRTMVLDIHPVTNTRLNPNEKSFFDLTAGFMFFLGLAYTASSGDYTFEELVMTRTVEINNPFRCPDYTAFFLQRCIHQDTLDDRFGPDVLEPLMDWPDAQTGPGIWWQSEDDQNRGPKYSKLLYLDTKSKTKDLVLFKANSDYIGLGPRGIAPGDSVCLLGGCSVPLVLRKVGNEYILLGPCFVYGLMDGEGAKMAEEGKVHVQSFLLR